MLAEERALREKMAKEFDVGKALRDAQTAEFVNIVKEKEAQRAAVQQDLDQAQEKLTEAESELDQIKHEYMQEHITRIETWLHAWLASVATTTIMIV